MTGTVSSTRSEIAHFRLNPVLRRLYEVAVGELDIRRPEGVGPADLPDDMRDVYQCLYKSAYEDTYEEFSLPE